ncbi:MAG: hypothetical protein JWL91_2435 [Sphingomonas bacterium]|nr:esterase-like activity of phytase family protein [Sphingomonas bacterium]MDB5690559.1 hypothetical protein [Sphingomonas bacterium]
MRTVTALTLVAAAALAAGLAAAPRGVSTAPAIRAQAVPLDATNPARTRIGSLRYLGGWALTSGNERFGGISAMAVRRGEVVALSDAGTVIAFRIAADGAVSGTRIAPLPGGPGKIASKLNRDSESLQRDSSGRFWIGFEGANAIWRYAADFARAERHAAPVAMRRWPENGGPEAMVRLADGRFLVFSEERPGPPGSTEALLFGGDPTAPGAAAMRLGYRAPTGYRVTDGAELPDGRVVLLNRRFTLLEGVSAIVTIVDPRGIVADQVLMPRIVARLAAPMTVDNMEALSVEREAGRTILWIASDDNFSGLQRTLLMKFALELPGVPARSTHMRQGAGRGIPAGTS